MSALERLTLPPTVERTSITVGPDIFWFPTDIPYKTLVEAYRFESVFDLQEVCAKLICMVAEDENRNKVFQPEDWRILLEKGTRLVGPLFQFVVELYLNMDRAVEREVARTELLPFGPVS